MANQNKSALSIFRNPRSIACIVGVVLIGICFHFFSGFLISHGVIGNWPIAAVAVIGFSLIFGVSAFAAAVMPERSSVFIIATVVSLTALAAGWSWGTGCAIIIEFFGLTLFMRSIQLEAANRIKLSLTRVMAYRSTFGVACGLLAVSCIFYSAVNVSVSSGAFQQSLVSAGVSMVDNVAGLTFSEFDPSMTVDELIRQQIPTPEDIVKDINLSEVPAETIDALRQRIADAGIDPNKIDLESVISNTTAEEQALTAQVSAKFSELTDDIVAASRQQISDSIGMVLEGDERIEDVIHDVLSERVDQFTIPQLRFAPLILTATLFLTLMLFNWFFILLALAFARLLLFIGVHTKTVVIVEEQVTAVRYRFRP